MVRVGGGWMALDEFLMKNDPCRGKSKVSQVLLALSKAKYLCILASLKNTSINQISVQFCNHLMMDFRNKNISLFANDVFE